MKVAALRREALVPWAHLTPALRLPLTFTIINAFLTPSLHTLLLLRVSQPIWVAYLYFSLVAQSVCYGLALLAMPKEKRGDFNRFEVFLGVLCLATTIMTLYYGGDPLDIVGKALRLVLIYTAYRVARNVMTDEDGEVFLRALFTTSLLGAGLAVSVVYGIGVLGSGRVFIAILAEHLFVPLAICLVQRPPKWRLKLFITCAMIFLSLKRGIILAGGTAAAYYGILNARLQQIPFARYHRGIGIALLLGSFIALNLSLFDFTKSAESLPPAIKTRFSFLTGDTDATDLTSGRNIEIEIVLRTMDQVPFAYLTGLGLGAALPDVWLRSADTVHIQPLFLTFLFGIPLGLGFFIWACVIAIRPFWQNHVEWPSQYIVWSVIAVGFIGTALTSAVFMQSAVLWVALGKISQFQPGSKPAELPEAVPG